ncbi:MAG: hydantoinase/oxoprolinase family protein [Candidatus Tectomicrobia bacterium]|nr:hydantoinase/oxoprolinase family protein [Candidatus Tectomicrobia bacterium]
MPSYILGFDIGGTFTDFVLLNLEEGTIFVHKSLTNPQNPAEGVFRGLSELFQQYTLSGASLQLAVHSTTLVTNAIIERKGAKTGLITTKGFRDILEMGREQFYDIYDLFAEFPESLVPRDLRKEVTERATRDGDLLASPGKGEVEQLAEEFSQAGVESIAITLLHSYKNPSNERLLREILDHQMLQIFVSLSSEVAPIVGEYERTSTTVADSYVKPLVSRYLEGLEKRLAEMGYTRPLYIMLSAGGTATSQTARHYPVRMIESGPAAGTLAGLFYGHLLGLDNLLCLDMGGTTAKASPIEKGKVTITDRLEAARIHRFKKGSGIPIMIPVLEMIEIGAGGGSIAWIDELGLLKVGPQSSGAEPGPACYNLGGTLPTVTDASLLLGYLNPHYFLGGRMELNMQAAERALQEVASRLGMTPHEVAWGIYHIVNENMAAAARIHLIERGKDPRNYTLVAFGGAGPAHATRVARILGIRQVISPLAAGVTSALGCLVAPLSFEYVRSYPIPLDQLDWGEINRVYREMEEEGLATMQQAGVDRADVTLVRSADMRLVGQIHEIQVPVPGGELRPQSLPALKDAFYTAYRELYHRAYLNLPIEALNWKLSVRGPQPKIDLKRETISPSTDPGRALKGTRKAYFPESGGFTDCPVYDRYQLPPGAFLKGPAIIEERESTAVISPQDEARIDEYLNLVIVAGS